MVRPRFSLVDAAILAFGGYLYWSSSCDSFASAEAQDTVGRLFSPEGPVSTMDRSTFISSVLESQRPALVWLYAGEDCEQCEQVSAIIEGAAPKLVSWGLSVVAVDISTETKLAKEMGVPKSVAMMFKVYHSESTRNPYGGLPVRREEFINNFQDARTLQKKALSAIPNIVSTVDIRQDVSTLREALSESVEAKHALVLFTSSGKASPVLRVLANVFGGKVAAIQARSSEPEGSNGIGDDDSEEKDEGESLRRVLKSVFEVKGGEVDALPSLILVDKEAGKGVAYEGDVEDAEAMLAFVSEGAGIPLSSRGSSSSKGNASGSDKDGGESGRRDIGGVLVVDPESLSRLEEEGVEALVVAFVKGGDVSVVPGWSEAVNGLTGQIRAGVLNCTEHPGECDGSGGKKAPHLRVYPHRKGVDGDNRSVPSVFSASEVKEALLEAEESLPDVVTVIPAGMNSQRTLDALQGFIGTSIVAEGGPMGLFVLSRREDPNLVVKTIAAQFQDVKIRTVFISQPEQETMAGLGVSKLPGMLLMFPAPEGAGAPNDGKRSEDGQQAMMTAHYSPARFGPISHENVSNFILSHLSSVDMEAFFSQLEKMSETASLNGEKLDANLEKILQERTGSSPGGDKRPPSPFEGVPEATAENWASITGEATGYPRTIGVFLLDRFADNFETVFQAAEAAARRASGRLADSGSSNAFAWVDVPCHQGFASAIGVSDSSEVPVLVAYSPKHQRSARFVGAWDEESMGLFLGKALGGREPLFPLEEEKPRLESVDCSQREPPSWQAGSGQTGIEDEDLGDLMAEIIAEEARAKQQLEEEVAKGLEELKEADKAETESVPKKKTKVVKRKKKKGSGKKDSTRSEL